VVVVVIANVAIAVVSPHQMKSKTTHSVLTTSTNYAVRTVTTQHHVSHFSLLLALCLFLAGRALFALVKRAETRLRFRKRRLKVLLLGAVRGTLVARSGFGFLDSVSVESLSGAEAYCEVKVG
jgi:hypothetical protein